MTVQIVAARPAVSHIVAGLQCGARRAASAAANDNEAERADAELLRAALRHFARHGLGAAEHARGEAERAFFEGDRADYDHWRAICRTLDRRIAASLAEPGRKTSTP